MKLRIYSTDGSNASEKDFAIREFEGDKGLAALKQVIVAYQANRRQGTVSTKTNATIHGTGKKPFRQKGTGMARQGARNRSQHYHGAVVFGPQPRDYTQRISKKLKRLALARALYNRASAGEIDVIERFEIPEAKTRHVAGLLKNINKEQPRTLVVDDRWEDNTLLAARNIGHIDIAEAGDVNALDLSAYARILISEKGIETLISRANGGAR